MPFVKRGRTRVFFLISLFLCGMGGLLLGQSIQYGKVTGKVVLTSGEPVPGVAVEISGDALISGKQATLTSASGTYVFLNLPIGKYTIAAVLEGFKTSVTRNVVVSAAAVTTINILMETGKIEESLTVVGRVPTVDIKTSAVDTRLNKDMLEKLPTSRDAFYDLSLTTPGMFDAAKDAIWLPSPTAYGSGANENSFLVNGVNATDPRGGAWGTLVNVNYNAVEEVRLIALGSKAEYGSSTGVAIDVVTKSGSNSFRGNLALFYQPFKPSRNAPAEGDDLGRSWLILDPNADVVNRTYQDQEFSLTLGGPMIKNKVWYFASANYTRNDYKKALWEVPLETYGPIADIKLSAEPFKNHRAWFSFHTERIKVMGDTWGDNVPWESVVQYGRTENNKTISSQWQWFPSQRTFLSAKYLGFWTDWLPQLPEDAPLNPAYINWWKWKAFGINGHFPYVEGHNSSRHTIQADISQYAENFLGEHDIKAGVQYTFGRGNELGGYFMGSINYAYPTRNEEARDIQYAIDHYGDTGMLWYLNQFNMPPFQTVRKYQETGIFIDDQWTPSKRLTVNLGLRFDNYRNSYGEGKVYEIPSTPNAINDPPPVVRTREGTGTIFNLSSLSPRVGLTYMLTKDGKTVLRANYGRYYMPIGLENLSRRGPDMPNNQLHVMDFSIPWSEVDQNGNGFIDDDEIIHAAYLLKDATPYEEYWEDNDLSWTCRVADDLKPQYTDQFTLNLEREIFKDFSVGFTYIYKNTGNIFVNWPINKVTGLPFEYTRVPFETPYGQNVELYSIALKDYDGNGLIEPEDIQWIDLNTDYEVRNLPKEIDGIDTSRVYNGYQLVFNKRFSNRWQMLASVLYSRSQGVANRLAAQDWNVEGPMIMDHRFITGMNELLNNLTGPLPFTPTWEIKWSGSYRIPKAEVDLGWRFRYNSGRAYWWIVPIPTRTFENPDEETAAITTGDSSIVGVDPENPDYLPPQVLMDLHLERPFKLSERMNLNVFLDVFNLFNYNKPICAVFSESNGVIGTVTAVTPPRRFRLGVSFDF